MNTEAASETHEDYRKLYIIVGLSVGVHVLIFFLSFLKIFKAPPAFVNEVAMDTELLSEDELGSAPKTVIPKAEIAKEVLVPDNQLPQVTKTFKVEDKAKEEEGLEPTKEVVKDEGKTLPDAATDGVDEQKPDITTKLKKSEALERLVRERLKDKTKPNNRKIQAEDNSELAQIRDMLKDVKGSTKGGIAGLDSELARYSGYLTGSVKKNFFVPPAFQITNPNGRALVKIVISATGELMQAEISESSGDQIFDDSCVKAVNMSAPFREPPEALAGNEIDLNCKPGG